MQTSNRVSVALTAVLLASLLVLPFVHAAWPAPIVAAALLLGLNWQLYAFFARRRGWTFALLAIPWHWLYYLYNSLSFTLGSLIFFARGARPVLADGALHHTRDEAS